MRQRGDRRQWRALFSRGLEGEKNTVRLIVSKQRHIRIRSNIPGKIEHDVETRTGSKRNHPPDRLEGFARLTIDREDQGSDPVECDQHQPRIDGAHDPQPQTR